MVSCNHAHIKQLLLHFSTLLNGKLYNAQNKSNCAAQQLLLTLLFPTSLSQNLCGWTVQWKTPSDQRNVQPVAQMCLAGAGGTAHS